VVAAVFQSLAVLAMAGVLVYLYRATKHRRPEVPQVALVLAIAGPIVYAILTIVIQVVQLDAASDFVKGSDHTVDHAKHLLREGTPRTVSIVGLAPSLALGFAFILISLHAMRAGLMSRFVGILGIIVGALYVIPFLGGPQIIQVFWIGAMGLLILDRWPGGRGPAWEAGRAIPWPTAADQRAEREAELVEPEPDPDPEPSPQPAASKKRKRKRRR
jgi:drug/metabolite transporter (DMT)-like permease